MLKIQKDFCPHLYAVYGQITDAKRNQYLLSAAEVEKAIHLLKSSLTFEDNDIPYQHPTVEVLDHWVWEILKIEG